MRRRDHRRRRHVLDRADEACHPEANPRRGTVTDIVPRLTDRQAQCLRYAADGYTDQQIATRTGLRVGTVKTHIKRARTLYGGVTRRRAAALAHRQIHDLPADAAL